MLSNRTKKLLNRIDAAKELINKYRPLPASIVTRLKEEMIIDWTYNSNAIEGNTLSLRETQLVLETGITIGGKSLKEHLEAINHREAILFVEDLASKKTKITERNIKEIHSLILKEIDPKYAGRYRDIQVRISGSRHLPPEAVRIPELMERFSKKRLSSSKQHPVEQAALAHFDFVSIHPFVDGNGRTARLLMNLILLKYAYFPAVILKNDRKKYYNALEKGHKGDINDFIFLVGRALERTINIYFEAIPKIKAHFISLAEAAKISPYSQDYLNVLARRGAIPAFKLKRNWVITKEALLKYIKEHK
jgi:Fic family protein